MYYKIVDLNLQSIYGNSFYPITSIQYKLKDWTYPKDERAPLCVFKWLEDAKRFIKENKLEKYKIYECAIKLSNRTWGRTLTKQAIYHRLQQNFLKGSELWPVGTFLADKVMLLKDVNRLDGPIYYKIVDNNLTSINHYCHLYIQYNIDEWAVPKDKLAPLMVFDNYKNASDFKNNVLYGRNDLRIYKCHIIKSRRKWCAIPSSQIDKALEYKKNKKSIKSFCKPPIGTIFADAVKLIERV